MSRLILALALAAGLVLPTDVPAGPASGGAAGTSTATTLAGGNEWGVKPPRVVPVPVAPTDRSV